MTLWKYLAIGVACSFLLFSCESPQVKPTPRITTEIPLNNGQPKILSLTDLGGLPLTVGGDIPTVFSDGRYSPGEWVMLNGKNLGVSELSVNGHTQKISYFYKGQPLVRLPTGMAPLHEQTISVSHTQGTAAIKFNSSHYIVATDTDGKKRHLIRTNPNENGGVEEEWITLESDAERPLFTLVSQNSAYFFTVNIAERVAEDNSKEANAYVMDIRTFHAAAPNAPQLLKQISVVVDSSPIDAVISSDDEIIILGKRSFTVVDATNPVALKEKKRVWLEPSGLEKTTYVDVIYFNNNRSIALLETYSNQVSIFDTKDYLKQETVNLLPDKSIALSVDLEPNPKNTRQFWALLGPNYRLTGTKMVEQYKRWIKHQDTPPDRQSVHQLVKLEWQDQKLSEGLRYNLDSDYAAYFAKTDEQGDVVITTTKLKFLTSPLNTSSKTDMLKLSKSILWDALSFGRVVKVDAETGRMTTLASGVGIYYDFECVPDIGPVFSLMKFGPSFSMPFITPNWGVGIKSTGTYAKRKMNKYSVFPPYSIGHIAYQR